MTRHFHHRPNRVARVRVKIVSIDRPLVGYALVLMVVEIERLPVSPKRWRNADERGYESLLFVGIVSSLGGFINWVPSCGFPAMNCVPNKFLAGDLWGPK